MSPQCWQISAVARMQCHWNAHGNITDGQQSLYGWYHAYSKTWLYVIG